MKIHRLLFGIFTASFLAMFAVPALANQECKADRERLCKDVPREGMHECMKKNEDKLSPGCKAFKAQKREQFKAMREACRSDREKFCGTIGHDKSDKGKVRECMKSHENELSASCREKIDVLKKWKTKTSQASPWDGIKTAIL
jgi:Cysteine rich repeat.